MVGINQRFIGGESGRRSFLGGARNRPRGVGYAVTAAVFVVGVLWFGLAGLVVSFITLVVVWAVTIPTGRGGSVFSRKITSHRAKRRARRGMNVNHPVSRRPDALADPVRGRRARRQRWREWNAYRDWPDGLVGLQWLQDEPGVPGIAWHTPVGEDPYLSVVVPLGGQIRGMVPDESVNQASEAFGRGLLAAHGATDSRIRRVQLLTRVLPPDTAAQETWANNHLDTAFLAEHMDVAISYRNVLAKASATGYLQRHYAVGRWVTDGGFGRAAERRGPGAEGWKALMASEISAFCRRLEAAGLRPGTPLTARQTAAIFRHLQLPSWPIDQAGDIDDPMGVFCSEYEQYDHTIVEDQGPTGQVEKWWHRTARVPITGVETGPRTPLWLLPLLTGVSTDVIRSVSFEFETVPARSARKEAREDLTSDLADIAKAQKDGALLGDDLRVAKRAVSSRVNDLEPGSGHHGGSWCLHVTISAPSRGALVEATERIEEAGEACGITDLEWLDGWGQAAHAATFPVARGLRPYKAGMGQAVLDLLGGHGKKEALR